MEEAVGQLQFFVRNVYGGQSIVVRSRSEDTVAYLHRKLNESTGIPLEEQRLIYNGRQLQMNQSLLDCRIQNDAILQLVCRMRSTRYPSAWQLTSQIVSDLSRLGDSSVCICETQCVLCNLTDEFFGLIPLESTECFEFFRAFIACSGPPTLVRLYASPDLSIKHCADMSIRCFLSKSARHENKLCSIFCLPVILDFCKLLRQVVSNEDFLYRHCRSRLAISFGLLKNNFPACWGDIKDSLNASDFFFFFNEVCDKLLHKINVMFSSSMAGIIREFSKFVNALMSIVHAELNYILFTRAPTHVAIQKSSISEEIKQFHMTYSALLEKINLCLKKLEESLPCKETDENETEGSVWSHHLLLLKELSRVSILYENAENEFWAILKSRKAAICELVIRYARRDHDYQWLLQHKEVTNFHTRRHLAMMMFPEVDDLEEFQEILIDRSSLLSDSLEYITGASRSSLQSGLFVEFKDEVATGHGVLREWFYSVIQSIFEERIALFVACPNDRRRFYPSPAINVDLMQLKYYKFAGRITGLAIMHKIQMGLVFDRVFFLQLAGESISLEDIQDADPVMYSSCKKIQEMDSDFLDSDSLGLTFEAEFYDSGVIKSVELCEDGRNKIVNSENREEYINLLIHHRFVESISQQLSHFASGFSDIIPRPGSHTLFFQSLDHDDLDRILHGNPRDVCVEDWQRHTDYKGFTYLDLQISWFWQIVGDMCSEKKHSLLFFWTSIKYLPFDGFRGLSSRLTILRADEPMGRLPSSHTCFYELRLPCYSSLILMREALNLITQDHFSCGFGTM